MSKQSFSVGQVLTAQQVNDLQTNDFNQTVSAKTASYTLVAADKGTRITMSSTSATTITVNTGLFAAGDTLFIQNLDTGVSTITAGTATVSTSADLALAQHEGGTLYFTSAGVSTFFKSAGAAAGGGGKVLQVIQATTTTNASNSTTTFQDTNLTATITPSAATSKILVLVSQHCEKTAGNAANTIALRLMKGATEVFINQYLLYTNSALINRGLQSFVYLDSPNTTSATTYKTQFANDGNNAAVAVQSSNQMSTITLMEIGA